VSFVEPGSGNAVRGMITGRASSGRTGRLALVTGLAAVAALLIAGCGTKTVFGAGATSSPSASSGFSAFRNCLEQHGVTPGSGGFGGGLGGGSGGGGTGSSNNSKLQQAMQACASLRPSFGSGGGGFGGGGFGGGGAFGQAIQAFRSCMSSHGETIPTTRPTSPPAGGSSPADRFLNGLNPGNPKVAAALKACESKLPSFAGGGGAAG
jgi:hypothetical protein